MSKTFLGTETYRSLLKNSISFEGMDLDPDITIQIVTFGSGGGGGFSPVVSYEIILGGEGSNKFNEVAGSQRGTPLRDFILNNLGVLFEKV